MDGIDLAEKYKQQYAQFGRLNDILYKLPVLFSSLIGGLWYFSFSFMKESTFVSSVVLLFAATLSIIFIFVVARFRLAFTQYLDNINKMDGEMRVTLPESRIPSTMTLIQISLGIATVLSLLSLGYVLCDF